ncbi:MAG: hypothetical protein KBD66_01990 [Candidatus Doudnabacteria bacterium]|nr:hypothetical protein [Candidatus Doudnabacteria bacterium]
MPQINLLGQDAERSTTSFGKGPVYIVRVFALLFLLLLALWGFLVLRVKMNTTKAQELSASIQKAQDEIVAMPAWRQVVVRQGQVKAAEGLLDGQQFWSRLLPELARVTLQSASYLSFSADARGTARMSVSTPSYAEFDKFLQVFDLPQFNNQFSEVTVSSVEKYQQGDSQLIRFDVAVTYDTAFLNAKSLSPSPQ